MTNRSGNSPCNREGVPLPLQEIKFKEGNPMNLYDQYLSLLQMFFHRQDVEVKPREKQRPVMPVSEKELFRDAA